MRVTRVISQDIFKAAEPVSLAKLLSNWTLAVAASMAFVNAGNKPQSRVEPCNGPNTRLILFWKALCTFCSHTRSFVAETSTMLIASRFILFCVQTPSRRFATWAR